LVPNGSFQGPGPWTIVNSFYNSVRGNLVPRVSPFSFREVGKMRGPGTETAVRGSFRYQVLTGSLVENEGNLLMVDGNLLNIKYKYLTLFSFLFL